MKRILSVMLAIIIVTAFTVTAFASNASVTMRLESRWQEELYWGPGVDKQGGGYRVGAWEIQEWIRSNIPPTAAEIAGQGDYMQRVARTVTGLVLPDNTEIFDGGDLGKYYPNIKTLVVPPRVVRITAGSIGNGITSLTVPASLVSIGDLFYLDSMRLGRKPGFTRADLINPNLTIYGPPGSVVEAYAQRHNIRYVAQGAATTYSSGLEQAIVARIAALEQAYGIKITNEWATNDIGVQYIEDGIKSVPAELHQAMLAHFRAKGQTIKVHIDPPNFFAAGSWTQSTATMNLTTMFPHDHTDLFLHEYGHMIHNVLLEKMGSAAFNSQWTALNNGYGYGTYVDGIFIEPKASHNIFEDVAVTYESFAGSGVESLLTAMESWEGTVPQWRVTPIQRKAELLERLAKEHLRITNFYTGTVAVNATTLTATTTGERVDAVKAIFNQWYSNNIRVVTFSPEGNLSAAVRASVRLDFTGMDINNLVIYTYNRADNKINRIAEPNYRIENGVLSFNTAMGGDIVISNGVLVRK